MAKKKTTKAKPTVTLRMANPRGGSMAKKKSGGRKTSHRRRSNPKKKTHHRRRRNPGTFAERAGKLLAVGGVALGTAVVVTLAQAKIAPGNPASLYGIPAATFAIGAAAARTMPTLGVGMAVGSVAPFALPVASKVAAMMTPATTPSTPAATAAGIARSMRNMRAVSMGRGPMGAIDMGAVDMVYG